MGDQYVFVWEQNGVIAFSAWSITIEKSDDDDDNDGYEVVMMMKMLMIIMTMLLMKTMIVSY